MNFLSLTNLTTFISLEFVESDVGNKLLEAQAIFTKVALASECPRLTRSTMKYLAKQWKGNDIKKTEAVLNKLAKLVTQDLTWLVLGSALVGYLSKHPGLGLKGDNLKDACLESLVKLVLSNRTKTDAVIVKVVSTSN